MRLQEAVEHFDIDRVVPFFQPIMDLSHDTVWRFECLARLVTPGEQTFLPSDFLHLVERQHSEKQLTAVILNRSAEYFRNINAAWNINISKEDMLSEDLLSLLAGYLKSYPNPKRVSLELTAAAVLENLEHFKTFALRCQAMHVGIYIDHFGATPGNINSILSLPISGIKIAGKLITQLMENQQTLEFVEHLTQQARLKDIAVVAVHVEDKATAELVKDLGIRYAQGFYFKHPKPET